MENTKKMDMQPIFYSVDEIMGLMDCSRRKAQLVINQLNQELDAMGMLTMRGKVQRTYVWEKAYGRNEVEN